MAKNKISDKKKIEVIKKLKSGEVIQELAKQYKIPASTLYYWRDLETWQYRTGKKTKVSNKYIYSLEREVEQLRAEINIFKESGCGTASSIEDKIKAIDALQDKYNIYSLCKTLNILRSTYYHQKKRSPEKTVFDERNEMLRPKIKEIFDLSKGRFGAKKISIKLKERGIPAGIFVITKLMKEMGLKCKQEILRAYNTTNKKSRFRKNKLRKNFNQQHPNIFWASDVTYMMVGSEDCYVCVILDLFSRKVIAHNVSFKQDTSFILDTFQEAYKSRGFPKGLTFHSDQGAQYTSYQFRSILRDLNVSQSFSSPATPYDNAVVESFFGMMKKESLSHKWYETIEDLRADVDEYINFFNDYRPLTTIKNKTPNQFEKEYFDEELETTHFLETVCNN